MRRILTESAPIGRPAPAAAGPPPRFGVRAKITWQERPLRFPAQRLFRLNSTGCGIAGPRQHERAH